MKKVLRVVGIVVAVVLIVVAGVALWKYHEQPQFCAATCHIMEPYLETWNGSDFQVHTHAQADIACLDCHEPTILQQVQEVAKYVTKTFEDPLKSPEYPNEFCLGCHEHESYAQLAEFTKDYTVDGVLMNPHDPHPGADPNRVDQEFECWHCHKMHGQSRGMDYCWGCHHDGDFTDCRECH